MSNIQSLLKQIAALNGDLYHKDFLLTWEKSVDELKKIVAVADALRWLRRENISTRCFDSGLAVSIFRDQSTRTRFSYFSAANLLGLGVQDLDEGRSQIAHGETVRETANMIGFFTEFIGIRDDIFLGAGHAYMQEVAAAVEDGFQAGVLEQRPYLVNLQSDIDHPTQSMADLMQLKSHFGSLENLRGKKIAMTWAYSPSYGKPLSVPQGVIGLMPRFGMEVVLAHPEGYQLIPDVVEKAGTSAKESGGSFQVVNSMDEAFAGADVVYPKSWAPYHVMEKRTELLRQNDTAGLKELEKDCLANNARFKDWECNEAKMKLTRGGDALYMHCLPADISGVSCAAGEVAASVFERYRIPTYIQAGFKPYVIAAVMLASRFEDPVKLLRAMKRRAFGRAGH
ncbi:MAG: knotted carbamoyltransferase YgeW [Desulfobacterales bacterium]|jgi:knotted carbamoyltransferase YgeW|nr:knotted carbamoyltransferase YgeW [Desulfobacterales bacterium]